MLLRNDVLDVVRELTVLLAQQAILTAVIGALPHQSAGGGIHQPRSAFRRRPALSFKIEMRSAALTRDSYSVRSSSFSTPSLALSARVSMRIWTPWSTRISVIRRADSASRQRLKGSSKLSRTVGAMSTTISYHGPFECESPIEMMDLWNFNDLDKRM